MIPQEYFCDHNEIYRVCAPYIKDKYYNNVLKILRQIVTSYCIHLMNQQEPFESEKHFFLKSWSVFIPFYGYTIIY